MLATSSGASPCLTNQAPLFTLIADKAILRPRGGENMSWNYETSRDRIKAHLENMPAIEVKKLEKSADLEKLLSESVCREIFGAHVYLDIVNFSELASTSDGDELRRVIRAMHVYHRQLAY